MTLRTKNSGISLDIKAVGEDGVIEGYASTFNVIDSYGDMVAPGAFKQSIASLKKSNRGLKMLWQHDRDQPIGIWDELVEDEKGLRVVGRLLKDSVAKAAEAYALIKEGILDELSIGYRELESSPHPEQRGVTILKKLDLREVSPVTFGALGQAARIDTVKSIVSGGEKPTVRQFEDHLREVGFSKSAAAAMASACKPHLRGEPEAKADDALAFLTALRG